MLQIIFFSFQIIALVILASSLSLLTRNKVLRVLLMLIISLYSSIEIISVLLTGKFIDYRFYFHMRLDSLKSFGFQFVNYYLLYFVFVLLTLIFAYFTANRIDKIFNNKYTSVVIVSVLVAFLFLPAGGFSEKYYLYKVLTSKEETFRDALQSLGIANEQYVSPDEVEAQKGKNIIVISLESLEKGFLKHSAFEKITPNLRRLNEIWTSYDMPEGPGGDWTAAAIYNLLVGMPAFFHGQGNATFQGTTDVRLTGLGHILKRSGYRSRYLIGNAKFAGISNLLSSYKIQTVSEKNSIGEYPKVLWGLHDYDLFQEAKAQIDELSNEKDEPFALFMSTINTHFPNGILDERVRQFVAPGKNDLELSIAAVDFFIGDFIAYLERKGLLDNTAVYILPDHLLMGYNQDFHPHLDENKRQLYLITNVNSNVLKKKTTEDVYQIELPRLIVEGVGIKTNAKFLFDFINDKDVLGFLEKNKFKLASLNHASQEKEDYNSSITINAHEKYFTVSSELKSFSFPFKSHVDSYTYDVTFSKDMVFLEDKEVKPGLAYDIEQDDIDYKRLHLIIELKSNSISRVYLGNKNNIGTYKKGKEIQFSKEDISNIVELNLKSHNLVSKEGVGADEYAKDAKRFIAHAGGQIDGNNYTNSLEALNLSYQKGFRLFELDIITTSDNIYVAAHDWEHWARVTGYDGPLPPTRQFFLEQKVFGKYTPMDIDSINRWFHDHQDATLVTDKIDTPLDFSAKFVDKSRLMMELFTWSAVREGKMAGIKSAMPTGSLVENIKNIGPFLQKMGVTDVAVSFNILSKKEVVRGLLESGINLFAFHINKDSRADEDYIVCKQRNLIYGMYADTWDFNPPLACSEAREL